MSETKQNSNAVETQPLIIIKQKSALVGFLLAFIGLGWFGIDRFYKGDIMLGLFKLFCPILALIVFAAGLSTAALVIIAIGCFFGFWIGYLCRLAYLGTMLKSSHRRTAQHLRRTIKRQIQTHSKIHKVVLLQVLV